jgi:hypothetical protein
MEYAIDKPREGASGPRRAPAGSLLRVVVLPFAVDDAVFLAPLRLGGWIITDGNGLGTCEETALHVHFRAFDGWFLVCFHHFSLVDNNMIYALSPVLSFNSAVPLLWKGADTTAPRYPQLENS